MVYTTLETERLILRPISEEDDIFILNHFSDQQVTRYLYDYEPVKNMDEANEILAFYIDEDPYIQCRWVITNKVTNEKMGTCGFHKRDIKKGTIEVGYDLNSKYWGQGYMSEALKELFHYAWKNLCVTSICAEIAVDNIDSIRLVSKLGFKYRDSYHIKFRDQELMHNKYELPLVSIEDEPIYICYCAKITHQEVRDMVEKGLSSITEIREALGKNSMGMCQEKNPKGICCHEEFDAFIQQVYLEE
ncbi:MAG: GNAT family N-acetyltransferase [Vallitaleaceae bacterium]|jgi:ribosomal-protein-alanine N-acetyltransferase|nr:GNAT family N-acetyltransferase [Vallitaleaceae bacterium]